MRTVRDGSNFSPASEVAVLIGSSREMSVKSLAERYGIQRAAMFSIIRCNVPKPTAGAARTAGRCDSRPSAARPRQSCVLLLQLCGDHLLRSDAVARASRRKHCDGTGYHVNVAGALAREGDSFDKNRSAVTLGFAGCALQPHL